MELTKDDHVSTVEITERNSITVSAERKFFLHIWGTVAIVVYTFLLVLTFSVSPIRNNPIMVLLLIVIAESLTCLTLGILAFRAAAGTISISDGKLHVRSLFRTSCVSLDRIKACSIKGRIAGEKVLVLTSAEGAEIRCPMSLHLEMEDKQILEWLRAKVS